MTDSSVATTQASSGEQLKLERSGSPVRWRVLWALFVGMLYEGVDLAMLGIVLPVVITAFHISLPKAGLLVSATNAGALVGGVLFGWFAENYGRKAAIVWGLVEIGVFSGAVYVVSTWGAFMVVRFIAGLGIGGLLGPCAAVIGEHWSAKYRAQATAFITNFAVASIIVSGMGAIILGNNYDWRLIFLIGSMSVLAGVYVQLAVPKSASPSPRTGRKERTRVAALVSPEVRKTTLLLSLFTIFYMAGNWTVYSWVPTFLVKVRGFSLRNMGLFMVIMYCGSFIGGQLFGMVARYGRRKALIIACLWNVVLLPIYLFSPSSQFLFWSAFVLMFGIGGIPALFGTFAVELFPKEIRAMGTGSTFNFGRIGAFLSPFVAGFVAQHYGLRAGIGLAPFYYLLAVAILLCLPDSVSKQVVF
jgi:predicted MFS family arabinose efflux permease